MAKISVQLIDDSLTLQPSTAVRRAVLLIDNVIVAGSDNTVTTIPADLISTDTPNDLTLGSDGKLLSQPLADNNAPDFLAIYLLARG